MNVSDASCVPPQILIVDDDDIVRVLLRQFLEGEGFKVHEAVDGASALDMLRFIDVDLVILDIGRSRRRAWSCPRRPCRQKLFSCYAPREDSPGAGKR